MRLRLVAAVLPLLAVLPAPPAAHASTRVTAVVVAAVDDEGGAGTVEAACAAYADPAGLAWTEITCSTPHDYAAVALPSPVVLVSLSAVEPAPYSACVSAVAHYDDGSSATDQQCVLVAPAQPLPGDGCRAFADPPESPNAYYAAGRGGIACAPAAPDLQVIVCLEALGPDGWAPFACAGASDPGPASYTEASPTGCLFGLYVIRTATLGTTGDGRGARAESPPVAFFCTPL